MTTPLFRHEVTSARANALEGVVAVRTPARLIHFALVCGLLVVGLLALLFWGEFSRRQTTVGQLVTDVGIARVIARGAAQVVEISVVEGQHVERGQVLARLQRGAHLADRRNIDQELLARASDGLSALMQQRQNTELLTRSETRRLQARLSALRERIAQTGQLLVLQRQQMAIDEDRWHALQGLQDRGLIARTQLDDAQRALLAARTQVETTFTQQKQVDAEMRDVQLQIEQQPLILAGSLGTLEQQIAGQRERVLEVEERDTQVLTAPTAGVVSGLQSKPGESLGSGALLMTIVPEHAKFHAILFVPSRAVGFIRPRQSVSIRYQAFPYQRFGLYAGKVVSVSETILAAQEVAATVPLNGEPVYRVTVELERQQVSAYGRDYALQSGMLLEADIALDRRPLWQWLFEPLLGMRGRV